MNGKNILSHIFMENMERKDITKIQNILTVFGVIPLANSFGEYGHVFLPLYVSFFIFYMKKYFWGYWIFLGANEMLIWILKRIFREKRPMPVSNNTEDYDYYGMPSGHSQHATYSFMFLLLLVEGGVIHILMLFMCGIVMAQRYLTQKHSLSQIFVGAVFGLFVGYVAFVMTKRYIVKSPLEEDI